LVFFQKQALATVSFVHAFAPLEALKTVSNYGWCTRDYIVELLPAPMPPINII